MKKTEQHRAYLDEVYADVSDALPQELTEHGATLRKFAFSESEEGIWAEAIIELPGRKEPWIRRRLIIPAEGPDKDAWFTAMLFSAGTAEDLGTR
ncbi:hypothetical protein [Streptomyces sp. NBC_00859]|uniref:hypothetical protein n=1 Tax=Streptomyces sp. NBC_00859 TaxID=2903682 RepID=UPI00386A73D0|nr:hypothetical protein OG584_12570 [Streptomyces sp. NBC_00859]